MNSTDSNYPVQPKQTFDNQSVLLESPSNLIPFHAHTGDDSSPKIDPKNLLGFPILTVAPTTSTYPAPDGTIVLTNIAGTRKLNALISGVWYSVTLT